MLHWLQSLFIKWTHTNSCSLFAEVSDKRKETKFPFWQPNLNCLFHWRTLITGGSDGDVRIYKGFEDEDPVSHQAGDFVYAVAQKVNETVIYDGFYGIWKMLGNVFLQLLCLNFILWFRLSFLFSKRESGFTLLQMTMQFSRTWLKVVHQMEWSSVSLHMSRTWSSVSRGDC